MVEFSPAQKRQYVRELQEDYAEFVRDHMAASKGRRWEFVDGRMIGLPGARLMEFVKNGWADCNGSGFRPMR